MIREAESGSRTQKVCDQESAKSPVQRVRIPILRGGRMYKGGMFFPSRSKRPSLQWLRAALRGKRKRRRRR